jgi:hypothetical protein
VEVPRDQISSGCQLSLVEVLAGGVVFENFFTDWNGAFDDLFVDLLVVKFEIEYVEVVSSVDSAHYWYSVDEMMRKFVTVALNNSVNRARRNILY